MSRRCAPEAELSVLGGVMLSNGAINRIATRPEDFADPYHGLIFEKMRQLADKAQPIDPMTLAMALGEQLETIGGFDKLCQLADAAASSVNIEYHARLIEQTALVRQMQRKAEQTAAKMAGGDFELDDVEAMALEAGEAFTQLAAGAAKDGGPVRYKDVATEAIRRIQAANENPGALTGTPTGFHNIDTMMAGLQPGTLIIVAGRPAMGKSALVLNMAANIAAMRAGDGENAERRFSVLGFSLEMPDVECATRLLAADARVDGMRLKSGLLSEGDTDRLLASVKRTSGCHLYLDDTGGVSLPYVRQKCLQLHYDQSIPPLGLVFIDYLQLMTGKGSNREQEISTISRGLKSLAKELGVPVIALSQLNRGVESRQNKRPILADLRESGAIEQDADVIMFVYRDEYYNEDSEDKGVAEVIVGKHRSGSTGTCKLKFFKQWTRFDNLQEL